jgi:hypothetical protein
MPKRKVFIATWRQRKSSFFLGCTQVALTVVLWIDCQWTPLSPDSLSLNARIASLVHGLTPGREGDDVSPIFLFLTNYCFIWNGSYLSRPTCVPACRMRRRKPNTTRSTSHVIAPLVNQIPLSLDQRLSQKKY